MLFSDGKAHKLDEIEFFFDSTDYLKPWQIRSSDGRLDMSFRPVLDRSSRTNLLLIQSVQHQCFGHFSGRAVLDDGQEIDLNGFPPVLPRTSLTAGRTGWLRGQIRNIR